MPCKLLQLLQRTERSNGPGRVKARAVFCFVLYFDMATLRENPAKSETFSGLHVKSHDQLKGAVRE